MAVASKIEKLQDSVIHTNIMIYGDSGVGKTVWCGSGQRVLFIAPEDSGTLSAKRHGSTASKWPVKTWNDLLEAYEYVYEQLEAGTFEFDVLAIDSLTEMQYMSMQHVLRLAVGEDAKRDPDVPQIQDWQRYYIIFEKMVRAFNDLPINVVYTALSRKVENAEGEDFYVPDIQGKEYLLSLKIASLMTSYGHMRIELEDEKDNEGNATGRKLRIRRIYWEDTGTSRGKDRTKTLAPYTDNLSLRKVNEKINGYVPPSPAKKAAAKKAAPAKAAPAKAAGSKADSEPVKQQDHSVAENATAAVESKRDEPVTNAETVEKIAEAEA